MTATDTRPAGRHTRHPECPECRARVLVAVDPVGDEVHLEPAPDVMGDHLVRPATGADPRPRAARLAPRQADGAIAAGEKLHLPHATACPFARRPAGRRPSGRR